MEIQIWGSRGSLPSPSGKTPGKKMFKGYEFGGNTTCFMIEPENGEKKIVDAGTGIRALGLELAQYQDPLELYITHTHWDHIQGFPFFVPAYIKGNKVDIYGEAKITGDLVSAVENANSEMSKLIHVNGAGMKDVFQNQQNARNFPAPLEYMAGLGEFYDFIPGGLLKKENGLEIETRKINHPGGCISYKFIEESDREPKSLIISTDFEPDYNSEDKKIVEWWRGADMVIADGQYEKGSKENPFMKTYGHSDPFLNVDLAKDAGVKHLVITHHEPKMDDNYLRGFENRVKKYADKNAKGLEVTFAREGDIYKI